ncbi:MAG: insulinase family protein [Acidobacteriota bacterium]
MKISIAPLLRALLLATVLLSALPGCTSVDRATLVDTPPVPPTAPVPSTQPASSDTPASGAVDAEPAASGDSTVQGALDAAIPLADDIRAGRLDNGLAYFIRVNEKPEQRAELRLAVDAGSLFEDEDQLGMAHFVEHMAFNGTENFEKQQLIDYLQRIGMRFGADINAYTSFDETAYFLTVPTDDSDALEKAFMILGDWAGGVAFDAEEIEKERGVILEEWRRSQGAGSRLWERQAPLVLRGSRYADRLPIGTVESIETSTPEAIRRYYESWYRPDLMAVIAVGDFDPEQIEALIHEHLGDLEPPRDAPARPDYPVPLHEETLTGIFTDPELTSTGVTVVYKHPVEDGTTYGAYRDSLVEGLYNLMTNARLSEVAQRAEPPFVTAFSGGGRLVRASYFYQLDARVQDGGVLGGLEALLREVERIDRHGFTDAELERAKASLLRTYEQLDRERQQQPSASFAAELLRHFLQDESVPGIALEADLARRFLPGIELTEVNQLGRAWITDENRVVLVTGPEKDDLELPTESELLAVFDRVAAADLEPWVDEASDQPLLAEAPTPGTIIAESTDDTVGITEWQLSNGARVLIKPTEFKDDQILLSAWSPGGHSLVDDEDFVSATFATTILGQSGLGDLSVVALRKKLAGKVATVSPFLAELEEGLSGSASPDDVETMLQLLYLHMTAPRLDLDAYQNLQTRFAAVLENRSKDPATVFNDAVTEALSQGHPRREPVTVETLPKIDPERALAVYRDRFADASDFTFTFVGAVDLDALRPLVETYLASLPSLARAESWADVGVRRPDGIVRVEVEKGLEPKATLQMVFHGRDDWSRDHLFDLEVLARVLEIRIIERIREELGAIYGGRVASSFESRPIDRHSVSIQFTCDPEKVEMLIDELKSEIGRIQADGPTPDVVEKVRENLRRQRQVDLQENRFWTRAIETYDSQGLDLALILAYDELLERVTPEQVQATARDFIDLERYVVGVLVPEATAAAAVGAASGAGESGATAHPTLD